ncbi:MAG TPA: hypothetical protein GXX67_10130 [Petrimonas sp.]|jgi:hypothetical protein|nr:hypothetical protein [Petrimonas sp.]
MKRIFTTLALAAVIIFAGCTDLDDVYRQLDEQEKELATVRALLNAMTNKVSVVSYKELPDGSGYELTMSDGTKITLKHGAKGNQGERGVKGQQGEDGQDASADLTITETDDTVIIVYKGVTYTISKSVPLPSMTFTTAKAPGGKLRLLIAAAEVDRADVWIDLNNNGNEDDGEAVTVFGSEVDYPLDAQTVTIYGKVTELDCGSNQLTALEVGNNTALESLRCLFNRITALDVSSNTALVELSCQYNDLTSLNVDNNTALKVLSCNYNQLTTLNVDNNTALESLSCNYNQLNKLDVSNNTALRFLWCSDNNISGSNMDVLVNGLPDRTGKEAGVFMAIAPSSPDEGNTLALDQAQVATGKNWRVLDDFGNPYTPPGDTPPGDVLNPLSLVAKYNVNTAGDGFVTSLTACNVSGYFTFGDAVSKFSDITIGGKQYHLPSIEEWRSIVPEDWKHVQFTNTNSYNDIGETVTVQGTSIAMTSDFRTGVSGVSYALRYKGTDMVSAWRYEFIENGNDTHMKITSRSLKGQTVVTVDEIAKPAFWSANGENDVIRHFPASGYTAGSTLYSVGTYGYFWSSSPYNSSIGVWCMSFYSNDASSNGFNVSYNGSSVRLFASGD